MISLIDDPNLKSRLDIALDAVNKQTQSICPSFPLMEQMKTLPKEARLALSTETIAKIMSALGTLKAAGITLEEAVEFAVSKFEKSQKGDQSHG